MNRGDGTAVPSLWCRGIQIEYSGPDSRLRTIPMSIPTLPGMRQSQKIPNLQRTLAALHQSLPPLKRFMFWRGGVGACPRSRYTLTPLCNHLGGALCHFSASCSNRQSTSLSPALFVSVSFSLLPFLPSIRISNSEVARPA
ncbi:hypothetical protein ASPBRDRAFT_52962 [Aspergillus brasiliensis CBS 101740]|uniref:Uncharacterized protein n=1 Tax=Aspergillus brasiliensis (strain CBS 101740 / IMI 381727 / IBT 21946) TaxID=767769 RepID=A0A1L9UTR4_ASPBC|nr:hypothetical protein ASPBRDRAFT_52962 [Aspergillus brasiliensis CBS 101740]